MMGFAAQSLDGQIARSEDEWRDLVRTNWSMECKFASEIQRDLRIASWFMEDLRFEIADLSGQQWTWIPGRGENNWRSHALVMLLVESGAIDMEQDGVRLSVAEGALLLFDASIEYTQTSHGDARGLALRLPRTALEKRGAALHSRKMFMPDVTSPDVAVLRSFIASTAAYGQHCTPHGKKLTAEHLIDLMEIVADDSSAPGRTRSSDAMLREVKRYIKRHVGDESMTVEAVANAMGVSRGYLTKLFERDGTSMTRYLLHQRLARAKRILATGGEALRISEVAWQCGFVSAAHFSNAFKKLYGVTPGELHRSQRSRHTAPPGPYTDK
ncbi:AraC family transcriptional regulator [Paraburkholderia sp. SARCC-3016]|uniref:AraC family transcriptional regulator n=1 Tax=Paraburkholderia sp. SARCC-3016 TaxID=3058611 RepID=UPI0028068DB5|nr:AraC family transcriptional regulator [Paraburkholderia sp. SARCC-3016]MDQ7981268.1 AraC family transcriptional regulator [Paraburkholderia sp. SARCC-3016]